MNHLHVHVISVDMISDCMKRREHYNSFKTEFFIELDDFPLAEDDPRRHQGHWPGIPLKCWRCGEVFDKKFKALTQHLLEEFDAWKRE